MFTKLWEFVGFLGIIILILILIGVIFAIVDTIYSNIKLSIVKREALKKLNEQLKDIDSDKIIIERVKDLDEEDVK